MKGIIVISGKGGVGKTLVSCLLAQELSKYGTTGLADLDVDSSNVASVMGIRMDEVRVTEDRKIVPAALNGGSLLVNSLGATLSDTAISQSALFYRNVVRDIITGTEWGDIEYLVLDMPPGMSDIFRETVDQLKAMNALLGAVVVAQPSSLEDCRRAYEICKRLFIPIIGFVENMSGVMMHDKVVKCPCGCGEELAPFGKGTIKKFAEEVGGVFLGRMPLLGEELQKPPSVGGVAAQTIKRAAERIKSSSIPKIPEDKIRQAAGTFKFVKRVLEALLALIRQAGREIDVATLRARYGRKEPAITEIYITDCPETLGEFRQIYVQADDVKGIKFYKRSTLPPNSRVAGGVRIGSGPLACVLKGKIPVMDPFTLTKYYEPYDFVKAVNTGDAEIWGDRSWVEFLLLDSLFRREKLDEKVSGLREGD
mgnify:FL=1